jgi:hypothetical protein
VFVVDGQRVEIRTESGVFAVVVVCTSCRQRRPYLPGLEKKASAGVR